MRKWVVRMRKKKGVKEVENEGLVGEKRLKKLTPKKAKSLVKKGLFSGRPTP